MWDDRRKKKEVKVTVKISFEKLKKIFRWLGKGHQSEVSK